MFFDLERVRINAQNATTEDLLDRVTGYRAGMEPEALDCIEAELRRRNVSAADINAHFKKLEEIAIWLPDGTAACCCQCHSPAVIQEKAWHLMWGLVPLFPRLCYHCGQHRLPPKAKTTAEQA